MPETYLPQRTLRSQRDWNRIVPRGTSRLERSRRVFTPWQVFPRALREDGKGWGKAPEFAGLQTPQFCPCHDSRAANPVKIKVHRYVPRETNPKSFVIPKRYTQLDLLPDAEAGEDPIQHVVRRRLAGDFPHRVQRIAQIHGEELHIHPRLQVRHE